MHTGQHIFSRIQESLFAGLTTSKVALSTAESVVYVHYDEVLTWDDLFRAEEETRVVILRNLPVHSFNATEEQARAIPELKIKWERIKDETIRVVQIEGIDATACAGTHVSSTADVKSFMVTGFNGSAPEWEIRFTVEAEPLFLQQSRAMRRLIREIGCQPNQLSEVFARQHGEIAAMRQVLDTVRDYVSIPWETTEVAGVPLHYAVLPGLTKDLLSRPARSHAEEHPDGLCLVLLPGSEEGHFPFLLMGGADFNRDLSLFIKNSPELQARGGGKRSWLNGTTREKSLDIWLDCLERHLKN
jgi:alanyl-tRNA synthetase